MCSEVPKILSEKLETAMAPPNQNKRKGSSSHTKKKQFSSINTNNSSFEEPYPDHSNPTPEECLLTRDALLNLHGFPQQFESFRTKRFHETGTFSNCNGAETSNGVDDESILDGLISTLLSQNTTDSNSSKAFESLKSTFPTWQHVVDADPERLVNAIRCGGLATTKAARIKNILISLKERRGELSLEYLRRLSVNEVKDELSCFKGIGPKTVACLLMFQLQKTDFPVDTHVFRITKSMGWIPIKADLKKAYLHLNKRIPDELKFDLNCLLVTHGKVCQRCKSKRGNSQAGDVVTSCPLQYVTVVSPDMK